MSYGALVLVVKLEVGIPEAALRLSLLD